jgi:hypothetical protein
MRELPLDMAAWDAVKRVARRPLPDETGDGLFPNAKKLLTSWKQKPVWPLYRAPEEAWYYVTGKPEKAGAFDCLTGSGARMERKHFGGEFFRDRPDESQVEFADRTLTAFDHLTQKNWTDTCTGLLAGLQHANGIDPILRYQLLNALVRDFSECDATINGNYGSMLTEVADREPDRFDGWTNAESPETLAMRKKAFEILAAIKWPDVAVVAAQYRKLVEGGSGPAVRFSWIGFLNLDSDGWKCERNADDMLAPGELVIVRAKDGNPVEAFSLVRVGQVDADHRVRLFDVAQMLQGAPVFLKTTVIPPETD